ncbi:MAG: hypothetical protein LBC28_01895, partial [Oscillospiraceae bacterium]|nr:hypothetical protein [Oscillospiraceae bacterium]
MKRQKFIDTRPARVMRKAWEIFVREHVTRSAAALSYCVTISLFPLLLCGTAVLGSLNITEDELFIGLKDIIPAAAIEVISDFLGYVGGN